MSCIPVLIAAFCPSLGFFSTLPWVALVQSPFCMTTWECCSLLQSLRTQSMARETRWAHWLWCSGYPLDNNVEVNNVFGSYKEFLPLWHPRLIIVMLMKLISDVGFLMCVKVVITIITGLPGSHKKRLCNFLVQLNKERGRYKQLHPTACSLLYFLLVFRTYSVVILF